MIPPLYLLQFSSFRPLWNSVLYHRNIKHVRAFENPATHANDIRQKNYQCYRPVRHLCPNTKLPHYNNLLNLIRKIYVAIKPWQIMNTLNRTKKRECENFWFTSKWVLDDATVNFCAGNSNVKTEIPVLSENSNVEFCLPLKKGVCC